MVTPVRYFQALRGSGFNLIRPGRHAPSPSVCALLDNLVVARGDRRQLPQGTPQHSRGPGTPLAAFPPELKDYLLTFPVLYDPGHSANALVSLALTRLNICESGLLMIVVLYKARLSHKRKFVCAVLSAELCTSYLLAGHQVCGAGWHARYVAAGAVTGGPDPRHAPL